jgi:hypothetical protein
MSMSDQTGIAGAQDQAHHTADLPGCLCRTERGIVARVTGERDELTKAINDALSILHEAPEINSSNYDHADACKLNEATCEAFDILYKAIARIEGSKRNA